MSLTNLLSEIYNYSLEDYKNHTVVELKKMCKELIIKGYSRLRKAELISSIQNRVSYMKKMDKIREERKKEETIDILTDFVKESGISKMIVEMKEEMEYGEQLYIDTLNFVETHSYLDYSITIDNDSTGELMIMGEVLDIDTYLDNEEMDDEDITEYLMKRVDINKEVKRYELGQERMIFRNDSPYCPMFSIVIEKEHIFLEDLIEKLDNHHFLCDHCFLESISIDFDGFIGIMRFGS